MNNFYKAHIFCQINLILCTYFDFTTCVFMKLSCNSLVTQMSIDFKAWDKIKKKLVKTYIFCIYLHKYQKIHIIV